MSQYQVVIAFKISFFKLNLLSYNLKTNYIYKQHLKKVSSVQPLHDLCTHYTIKHSYRYSNIYIYKNTLKLMKKHYFMHTYLGGDASISFNFPSISFFCSINSSHCYKRCIHYNILQ